MYTAKGKGGKPDRKPYPIPYGLRNPFINLRSESLKIMSRILKKLYIHEFGLCKFCTRYTQSNTEYHSGYNVYWKRNAHTERKKIRGEIRKVL
jgi:hypothetical protein